MNTHRLTAGTSSRSRRTGCRPSGAADRLIQGHLRDMAFDPNRWTHKTQEAARDAVALARQYHHAEVTPEHFLYAALGQDGGVTIPLLDKLGVSPLSLKNRLDEGFGKLAKAYGGGEPSFSRDDAGLRAGRGRPEGDGRRVSLGRASPPRARRRDRRLPTTPPGALREIRGSHRVTSQEPEETYRSLERYGSDFTNLARLGKLDPVIGRDEEIRRVIQVLLFATKNNPVLIGEPSAARRRSSRGSPRRIVER